MALIFIYIHSYIYPVHLLIWWIFGLGSEDFRHSSIRAQLWHMMIGRSMTANPKDRLKIGLRATTAVIRPKPMSVIG